MKQYIGIRFSRFGQVRVGYFDNTEGICFNFGQSVVAQTESALYFGQVVWQSYNASILTQQKKSNDFNLSGEGNPHGLSKPKGEGFESFDLNQVQKYILIRNASIDEFITADHNFILSQEAFKFCKNCIKKNNLDMKLIDVEVLFDKTKMIFYFTAPTRIDFRELVKDLVREYRTRIELRQIGVRHETQMLGTLGSCGMVVCCRRFLKEFAPVTIKMAKEQNLFLNPTKISGMCGRLLCCLSFEQDNYDYFHRISPKLGKRYQTDNGIYKVLRSNMFRNSVSVLSEAEVEEEIKMDVWNGLNPKRIDISDFSNEEVTEPLFCYFDDSISSEAELSQLLDDSEEFNESNNQDKRKKTRAVHKPKEKAQKRRNFDSENVKHHKK